MESIMVSIIGDLWSVHLAIMGILVSVTTLLFASLSSKAEELDSIKNSTDYVLMNRATAVKNSIATFRKLNKQVMYGLIITFGLFTLSSALKYLPNSCITNCVAIVVAVFTICLMAYGIYLWHSVYSQYKKETT